MWYSLVFGTVLKRIAAADRSVYFCYCIYFFSAVQRRQPLTIDKSQMEYTDVM